ncbi:hypothetical protein ACTXT7_015718 [Hymenolepis weldensis]
MLHTNLTVQDIQKEICIPTHFYENKIKLSNDILETLRYGRYTLIKLFVLTLSPLSSPAYFPDLRFPLSLSLDLYPSLLLSQIQIAVVQYELVYFQFWEDNTKVR